MGYMRHHAIVVTSWNDELIEAAHAKAIELGCQVSDVTRKVVNGYRSFFLAPDGSKEGWPESAEGDRRRDAFVAWLQSQAYDDGSTSLNWAEVRYGDDESEASLTRASDRTLTTGGAE